MSTALLVERVEPVAGFTASSAAEPDAVLRARLADDGYLFVRGLVAPRRLLRVRALILGLCREHGWLDPEAPPDEARPKPGLVILEPQPEYHRLYQRLIRTALFNALAQAPEPMALFPRLLGDDVLAHPRNIARIIFPGAQTTQPHQDFRYIDGAEDTCTLWMPLGDCPRALGSLAIRAGSHRAGALAHVPAIGAGGSGVPSAELPGRWLASDFACGDAVLFHSRTVHAGLDNRTGRLRLSVDFRYQRAGDPIDPSSLLPHYHGSPLADVR